jgi:F-type H+-transporting ATP synthase subunit e
MMQQRLTNVVIQVLRYSALAVGVAYGFYHQRTITQHVRSEQAQREYKHKEQLIAQAKAEFAKSKQPASAKTDSKAGRTFLPRSIEARSFPFFALGERGRRLRRITRTQLTWP